MKTKLNLSNHSYLYDNFNLLMYFLIMNFFKRIRKNFKNTFLYNILQNFFFRPNRSYSNCFGEDLFINYYFSGITHGTYIDIGCNQPVKQSLTFLLTKKGWKGFNFDISRRCIKLYDFYRKKDFNENISIGEKECTIKSYIFYENCSMNTVNQDFSLYTKKSVNKNPKIEQIRQTTLDKVCENHRIEKIDYLNIDVEGNEANVLKGFNISKYQPTLVSIEIHDETCPPFQNFIYKYFISNRYKLTAIYGWTYFFEIVRNKKIHFKI